MQLFIKTLSGKKQNFNFEPENTVLQIKQALEEKEGISVSQIKLIFGGKQLGDEQRIADVGIKAGDTLHMVL